MRIEQVYLVKSCTTVHACCDTVCAYQSTYQSITASDSHVLCSRKQQVIEAITLQSMLMVPLWLLQVADQLPRHRRDPASLLAAGK